MSRLQLYSTATAAALVLVMLPGAALAEPSSSEVAEAAPVMTMPLTDSEGTPTETATALVGDPSAAHSPDEDAAAQSDGTLAQTTDAPESGTSEGGPIAILTEPLSVDNDFLVAGVTWGPDQQLAADSEISIRVREDGRWSDWYPMGSDGSGRDDGVGRPATEPFITGGADAVQVQVAGEAVDLPADLAVTMVPGNPQGEVTLDPDDVTPAPADPTPQAQVDEDSDADETVPQETSSDGGATVDQPTESGTVPSDQSSTDGPSSGSGGSIGSGGTGVHDTRALLTSVAAASTAKDLPVNVITRAQWGANESYMTWDPEEASAPFVIVHHTVGTNDYSASQSAGIVNGIYYYHAVTLGWGDIGYNFLVDKYGQVFEGRAGSASATPGKMVAGAHAQGANTGTMGIAMMGTYTSVSPTSAELTAVGKMAGWQLSRAGVDPRGSATFTITYSNGKYNVGDKVTLNRVAGHRDVYATECPGNIGYTTLGTIRSIAATVTPGTVGEISSLSVANGSATLSGWAIDPATTSPITVDISIDGGLVAQANANQTHPAVSATTRTNIGFTATITIPAGTHTVCARAMSTTSSVSNRLGCQTVDSSYDAQGAVESMTQSGGTITIKGWATDEDTSSPITVDVSVDGGLADRVTANQTHTKVSATTRTNIGFTATATIPTGTHTVCARAIGVDSGDNPRLACQTFTLASPMGTVGEISSLSVANGSATLSGWAIDPATTSPITVDISIDGGLVAQANANQTHPAVSATTRTNIGFTATITIPAGTHTVCARAMSTTSSVSNRLGCQTVDSSYDAQGAVESMTQSGGTITIKGWATDEDTSSPITVDVSVDGGLADRVTANQTHTKVSATTRTNIGFTATATIPTGTHTVCARAIGVDSGDNPRLACQTFTLASPMGTVGEISSLSVANGSATLSGWAIDPATTSPITVDISIDGGLVAQANANQTHPAVSATTRTNIGFTATITIPAGTHTVCARAMSTTSSVSNRLGCQTVDSSYDAQGAVESMTQSGGTITIKGWATDEDTSSPITVDVSVDGGLADRVTANQTHTKVSATTRTNIGFTATATIPTGTHTVCARAIGVDSGDNPRLACQTFTLAGFIAGNIISDANMFDSTRMSTPQVQSFLTSINPLCVKGNDGTACLKDYVAKTTDMKLPYCDTYRGASSESAAQILAKSASACGINPQVLIVLLQKEQGLVTASGVSLTATKYERATGYSCPDSTGCDPARAGFQTQVYGAASQLVRYGEEPMSYRYRAGQTTAIAYNPSASCGSSAVFLENRATAALYNYTPYQPNKAALDNMYGTGDACSAYGNRNFWRLFRDWFGVPN